MTKATADARNLAAKNEFALAGFVDDLKLVTDYEELFDTLKYLHGQVTMMMDEAEQLWGKSQED